MNKKQQAQQHGELTPAPTCENCVHTFKHNGSEDMVVCVPHLKTMPAGNSLVCDLHSIRSQRT